MTHWIILPIVIPALLAPIILLVMRYHIGLQRVFSVAGVVSVLAVALVLLAQASSGAIETYELGNWPAPFGIVLVLDRLSALMVVLTALLALIVVLYAAGSGWDKRGRHFHALFQFQIMGVMGAFLTGDAFNLFVFFEVLLIASYGLMIHSGGAQRLRAGVQYVVYNLLGSTLFLFALGVIYATTGTLNMADLAVRLAELPADDTAILRVGAVLLLLVFCVKAAVLPLHFWLPGSYANAPAPVAALFSIMTKVGAYAILRMFTLVFGPDQAISHGIVGTWLLPAAVLTLAIGSIGILGAREINRLAAYAAITSMGTLLIAISLFTPEATAAALYYIVHSTFAAALLFLVADQIIERRGAAIAPAAPMAKEGLIAAMFFATSIAVAGMPPLSGFLGKLLVLDAVRAHPSTVAIWVVVLVSSLITIIGLARAGSAIFWKSHDPALNFAPDGSDDSTAQAADAPEVPSEALSLAALFALLALLVALTVFAGPMMTYAKATATQLFDTSSYIDAVLKGAE